MSENPNNNTGIPANIPTPADFFGWLNQIMSPLAQAGAAWAANVPTPADPLTMWRTYSEKNEEIYAKFLQQLVSTPAFAQTLGRSSTATARYREMVKQAAKVYLETADMPTREDITRIASQLVALDAKVDDLSDGLSDDLTSVPSSVDKMVTTLEALGVRLEQIDTQFYLQNERIGQVTERLARIESQMQQGQADTTLLRRLEQIETQITHNQSQDEIIQKLAKIEAQLENLESKRNSASSPTIQAAAIELPDTNTSPAKPASRSRKKPVATPELSAEPITES